MLYDREATCKLSWTGMEEVKQWCFYQKRRRETGWVNNTPKPVFHTSLSLFFFFFRTQADLLLYRESGVRYYESHSPIYSVVNSACFEYGFHAIIAMNNLKAMNVVNNPQLSNLAVCCSCPTCGQEYPDCCRAFWLCMSNQLEPHLQKNVQDCHQRISIVPLIFLCSLIPTLTLTLTPTPNNAKLDIIERVRFLNLAIWTVWHRQSAVNIVKHSSKEEGFC